MSRLCSALVLAVSTACTGKPPRSASQPPISTAPSQAPALLTLPAPAVTDTATLRLAAWCAPGSAEPSALEISFSAPLEGAPVFRLEDVVFGSAGMTKLIAAIEAFDEQGPLVLANRAPAEGAGLELAASRRAVGSVTLRYRAHSVHVEQAGARFGLRHDATGIGGHGAFFLLLPSSSRVYRTRIEWGAPVCPESRGPTGRESAEPGTLLGTSSFGFGSSMAETRGTLDELRMAAYFAGYPRVAAADGEASVRSAWFGNPKLDVAAATNWAARAFAVERAFFGDEPAPYFLFFRVLPSLGDRSNGMGQPSSAFFTLGPELPFGQRLKVNMAHEMLHRWFGLRLRLAGPDGSHFWFSEGFTVHYTNVLMLRGRLLAPDEFLAELNGTLTRHFANPRASASNDEIRRGFFEDDALSVVPYTRGALYAAELDAAIRKSSAGTRSLDALLRELYASVSTPEGGASGRELDLRTFRDAILRYAGQAALERFDAVIAGGAQPDPPSDAYGPCFERVPRAIAPFELGFDEKHSLAEPREVRNLIAGSAAARAGLREGDRLISIQSKFLFSDKEVEVTVRRGGKAVVVRYLPAQLGAQRQGYEWVRSKGVPDDRCAER